MKALVAVAANKAFLYAIQIAWVAVVITGFWVAPNNFTGALLAGADWLIGLVMLGGKADHQGIYLTLMLLFPAVFIMLPALACLKIRNKRGAQNAST